MSTVNEILLKNWKKAGVKIIPKIALGIREDEVFFVCNDSLKLDNSCIRFCSSKGYIFLILRKYVEKKRNKKIGEYYFMKPNTNDLKLILTAPTNEATLKAYDTFALMDISILYNKMMEEEEDEGQEQDEEEEEDEE